MVVVWSVAGRNYSLKKGVVTLLNRTYRSYKSYGSHSRCLQDSPRKHMSKSYNAVVIGAGVFGSWTAYYLQRAGLSVALIDAYGAANSRASSGGESRIIRMSYGADEIYTRWSERSMAMWLEFFARIGRPELFHRTGVLLMSRENDSRAASTLRTLEKVGVNFERLGRDELERR